MKLFYIYLAFNVWFVASGFRVQDANHIKYMRGNVSQAPNTVDSTFVGWYDSYSEGRGIWKWRNALEAYQTHFQRFQNTKVSLVEIGVQSGGSIDMFRTILGSSCHYFGCDINPKCTKFADATATITIMDQGDPAQWVGFYANVAPMVDLIVDDGGHQPYQMLVTLQQSFAHINPGGVHLVEDIHGMNGDYNSGFFTPAADFLGAVNGQVAAVHMYPFVLVVQKAGGTYVTPVPTPAAATFDTVEGMMTALPNYLGKVVHLKNAAWPPLLGATGLKALFTAFYELNGGKVTPDPPNCFEDAIETPDCTMYVSNTALQNLISGVHIFPGHVEIVIAAAPPSIHATRKGTQWIPYSG